MPLPEEIAEKVDEYARADLAGDLAWHVNQFSFLADDAKLQLRVGEEFYTARYLYKLLEGVRPADSWAKAALVRLQILQYASIYEACLHHLLFNLLDHTVEVKELGTYRSLKRYSVPEEMRVVLGNLHHDGRQIIATFEGESKTDPKDIRFESKVDAAVALKMVTPELGKDLKKIYEARNSIHLHAELRKNLEWDLEDGRIAYLRMQPFCSQLSAFTANRQSSP